MSYVDDTPRRPSETVYNNKSDGVAEKKKNLSSPCDHCQVLMNQIMDLRCQIGELSTELDKGRLRFQDEQREREKKLREKLGQAKRKQDKVETRKRKLIKEYSQDVRGVIHELDRIMSTQQYNTELRYELADVAMRLRMCCKNLESI